MYAVTVIPFAKSIQKDTLTYFTAKEVAPGMLVTVPIRKKDVRGLAIAVSPIEDTKSTIKNADFTLRKIKRIDGPSFLGPAYLKTVSDLANYYVTSQGAVLYSLVPAGLVGAGKATNFIIEKTKSGGQLINDYEYCHDEPH